MKFRGERESRNFEDYSAASPFENLLRSLIDPPLTDGAPGGYAKYVTGALRGLTPHDIYIMKTQGYTMDQMYHMKRMTKAVKKGDLNAYAGDAYPYNEDFAEKIVKYQKGK